MSDQRDRVLRQLERAGDRGVCAVDFSLPDVCDGGPPITRVAARIYELRQAGYQIEKAPERRHKCDVYKLAAQSDRLFDPPLPRGMEWAA